MSCFNMLPQHMDITLTDGSTLQGGEWPGVPWYPDTPETGATL